jgi:type II secretory pathway pseudopilin PulG
MNAMRNSFPAFTIIELLVVIAVIAVLIAIIAPSLDRARESGLRTAAISNAHQIGIAGAAYQHDSKDALPFTPVYRRGMSAGPDSGPLKGPSICPWSFAGKNNDAWWAGRDFDIEAADRPLNPYIAPGSTFPAPDAPATLGATDPDRTAVDLPVLHIRGFEDSLERSWATSPGADPTATTGVTAYDDVGTSYLLNLRWIDRFAATPNPLERLRIASGSLRSAMAGSSAAGVGPSHFVWFTDQSGEAVPRAIDPEFSWNSAFDDDNRAILGFADGHIGYFPVKPGLMSTKDYSFTLSGQ